MIAARQELDLRPQLERLDPLICRSEGIDEGALSFAFRPLWQLDEPAKAALALSRAQATQVYAGLKLWPAEVTAKLVEAQLIADRTYPNAATVFAEDGTAGDQVTADAFPVRPGFNPAQPRAPDGRWTAEGGSSSAGSFVPVAHHINEDPDPTPEEEKEELEEKLKAREDPQRFFRFGPDPNGILRIPMMPGSGKPGVTPPAAGASGGPVAPAAKPPMPGTAVPPPRSAIRFGANPNQTFHAYRHTDDLGLDRVRVEEAIRNHLISNLGTLQDGLIQGSVIVDGQKLEYNAFKLPNGDINVGRITTSK
ncbi:DUF1073 domain-containing protein [Lichenibacterium minor]|uniref:DUF1073 domain-containing protein n=1 Tax=Lichenibacterium minor TaxID=2316528 RepID=A0A4Q2UB94_9HYPH|nr:anti-CBASS Acb1 family protein [Lichenibacterium minor]RYC32511.1 DUF1073 domain-containing protein [Lichenibacterium minor]